MKNIKYSLDTFIFGSKLNVLLTDKKIVCGKWTIPLETISTARLIKINSLFGGGQVLKIQTIDNSNYQFGMQFNTEWVNQKILPLTLERGKVRHSATSIIVRLIIAGYVIYWIYERYMLN